MSRDALAQFVAAKAKEFDVPGIAAGVWAEGREVFACHGVTSIDNPLPSGLCHGDRPGCHIGSTK